MKLFNLFTKVIQLNIDYSNLLFNKLKINYFVNYLLHFLLLIKFIKFIIAEIIININTTPLVVAAAVIVVFKLQFVTAIIPFQFLTFPFWLVSFASSQFNFIQKVILLQF